jgi:hypothetical protein
MGSVSTAQFEMTRSAAPVTLGGLVFESARGRYAAPGAAEAVLTLQAGDISVEMGTVSIGERTWLTNPITGRWEELPPGDGFNPALLFDTTEGWVAVLQDLEDVSWVANENRGNHLVGTVPATRVEVLTAGLASGQSLGLDLWLDPGTGHIVRLEFTTVGEMGDTDWVISMSGFGDPVQIDPPTG